MRGAGGRGSAWIVALLGALVPAVVRAGDLQDARDEVGGGSSSDSGDSDDGDDDDGDDGGGGGGGGIAEAFGEALGAAMASGAREVAERLGPPRYAPYPYADGHHGLVHRDGPTSKVGVGGRGKPWSLRAGFEGAYLGEQLWRPSLDVELSWWRVAIRSDLGLYLERPERDALYLGATSLQLALVLQPKVVWKLGAGAGYMIDARKLDDPARRDAVGVNGTTSLDVFLVRPLVVSGRADVGKLGPATTFTARGTLGFAIRRFEAYGGYEYRGVGRVRFAGPVFGVRLWF